MARSQFGPRCNPSFTQKNRAHLKTNAPVLITTKFEPAKDASPSSTQEAQWLHLSVTARGRDRFTKLDIQSTQLRRAPNVIVLQLVNSCSLCLICSWAGQEGSTQESKLTAKKGLAHRANWMTRIPLYLVIAIGWPWVRVLLYISRTSTPCSCKWRV